MLRHFFSIICGVITLLFVVVNTLVFTTPLFFFVFIKSVFRLDWAQRYLSRGIVWTVQSWIDNNSFILHFFQTMSWEIQLPEGLDLEKSYMVISNHCSWADIAIIQWVFNRKIPVLRFFVKQELKWIPVLGLAFWALDFPFMKRYSKKKLEDNPQLRGQDIETTRKACRRLKSVPVAILNFLEGTRYSQSKYQSSAQQYQYLLQPKAGGTSLALNAMDGSIRSLINITLVYHDKHYGLWDMMCGRLKRVTLKAEVQGIPQNLLFGDYQNDQEYRQLFQNWINDLWQEKDQLISLIKNSES